MATQLGSKIVGGFGQSFGEVDPITGQAIGEVDPKLTNEMGRYNRRNVMAGVSLTRAHKASEQAGQTCYIYNISPIVSWERRLNNFGIFLIPKAPSVGSTIIDHKTGKTRKATEEDVQGEYRLSEPLVINHSYVRTIAGEGKLQPYIDYGEEISEDIVGCSGNFPPGLNLDKDLTKKGVFIVYGKRFEECTAEEQEALLSKAEIGHLEFCQTKVTRGDQLYEIQKTKGRGGPLEVHKKCANYLAARNMLDLSKVPWVMNRSQVYKTLAVEKDCVHCYSKINAKATVCYVCKREQEEQL